MLVLVIGLIVFFAIHLVPANIELRNGLVGRFGETGYKAIFGVLSLVGLVLIVLGFHKLQIHPGKNPQLWVPAVWTRHIATALMLPWWRASCSSSGPAFAMQISGSGSISVSA